MPNLPEKNEPAESSILDTASEAVDIISDVASGIPTPVKKNFLRAFGQLCTAAVDIPVAHLEGRAAEIRAESKSRVNIIETGSKQITTQMNVDPKFAEAAAIKYGQRIVREQINLDDTVRIAAEEIKQSPNIGTSEDIEAEDISDDWLNTFEREAVTKSSDEMKLLFGKILAGEIQRPSSFSIKTLKTLSQLDNKTAKTFLNLCSLCTQIKSGHFVIATTIISLGKSAGGNGLKDYSMSFNDLTLLSEYGLIALELEITGTYDLLIEGSPHANELPFTIQGKNYKLHPKTERDMNEHLKLTGVSLSNTGTELFSIIEPQTNNKYIQDLKEYFKTIHLDMVELEQN